MGRSGRVRPQALGLSLHGSAAITLEIGSRFFVERSHRNSRSDRPAIFVAIGADLNGFAGGRPWPRSLRTAGERSS